MKQIRSFNKMHAFFTSKITDLYETVEGKKIIGNYIKLLKENAILRRQFDLYTQLEEGVTKYIKESGKEEYVNEILKSFDGMTKKQLTEANNKLFWFLIENEVITETENPWGKRKGGVILKEGKETFDWIFTKTPVVFRSADYLLYEGKKDLSLFIENKKRLGDNLILKEKTVNEEVTPEQRIKNFNQKYRGKLTNEEMNLVRELVKTTKPQGVIVEYQKSVTNSINDLIKETEDFELKNKFLQLKEQVLFEDYSNLDKAMKLFEIRQVIDEIKTNK